MKISDKELDDLFNSKLNNIEAEPSADLWDNIAAELDQKPKRKNLVPVLRIAAGIIVIFSVGLLFLRKDVPVENQLPKKLVKAKLQQQNPADKQIEKLGDKNSMLLLTAKNEVVKTVSAKRKSKALFIKPLILTKPETENTSTQILAQTSAEIKPNPELQNNQFAQTRTAIVPDVSISLKPQPETEIPTKPFVKPQILAAANTSAKVKHKRIRSFGDVVNLVMAKVDKREDKLIQFSDSDDGDESNVTGINLGIINLKKEK
ncbi:MAG: hypothetical protein EOP42_22425 [Sphingobacteriaceae bacterium]|nr:MAG: hypothetical protein EOP42_22425 [Sphingobacteriaceae bacterium]